jgi:alkanesulfonate monooxygenase SsuD/methylene tetrahydromethanopterin reductase-like flavin-dependent oxidoreductase (luciferase family)
MKLSFFHLMPYQYLPDDFEKRHRSVYVDPPNYLYDPSKGHELYNRYLDEMIYAEQLGFDGVCVNEHHSNAYGLMPSPNLMAAALARQTSKAAIIVLGNSLALYNPPTRIAEELAMLDVMSGGRVVAGFPVGSGMDTVFSYGEVPATLREKYREAHDLIIKSWTEREPFAFNGKYSQLRYVNVWPRPIQQPHPPIWIPAGGSLETFEWTIQQDYMYSYLSYSGYRDGKQVLDRFWEVSDNSGVEFNPHHAGFLQFVAVSETDAQVDEYAPHIEYFYNKLQHIPSYFLNPPGYRTVRSVRASGAIGSSKSQRSWRDYIDNGSVIAGSPATVREELRQAIKDLRVGHLMLILHFGSMPKELAAKNTELFAKEVMPFVKDMWSEYEDRWWPKALPEADRAVSSVTAQV